MTGPAAIPGFQYTRRPVAPAGAPAVDPFRNWVGQEFQQVQRATTAIATAKANTVVNVKDPPYNAQGDGVTDDTKAIQAAIDAASVNGSTVWVPPGIYLISADLTFASPLTFEMDGATIRSTHGRLLGSNNNITIDGRTTSTFQFADGGADPLSNAIFFSGGAVENLAVTGSIAVGDTSFVATHAADVVGLVANDWIIVGERTSDWQRQEWKQVDTVVGTTVAVTSPFRQAFATYTRVFWRVTPIENCVIRNLHIVTTGVVNDNVGVDAELSRNFSLTNCTFDIAKGLSHAIFIGNNAVVRDNHTIRCTRPPELGATDGFVVDGNTVTVEAGVTGNAGGFQLETGAGFGVVAHNTIYGQDIQPCFEVTWCNNIRFAHNTCAMDGIGVAILFTGCDDMTTVGNDFVNVLEAIRYFPDAGQSPTRTANGNSSYADKVRTATTGVNITSGAARCSVWGLDVDASVTTPVTDNGTDSVYTYRDAAGVLHFGGTQILLPSAVTTLAGAASSVTQLVMGTSSSIGSVGTMFSDGGAVLVSNALQPTFGTDLWHQADAAAISILLVLRLTTGKWELYHAPTSSADAVFATFWGSVQATISATNGNMVLNGSVTTESPSGGTAGAWKLGIEVSAASTVDLTKYIQVDVGGTLYKLATMS